MREVYQDMAVAHMLGPQRGSLAFNFVERDKKSPADSVSSEEVRSGRIVRFDSLLTHFVLISSHC